MTVNLSMDPVWPWAEQIERAEPDLLRRMVKTFVEVLMSAEADAVCGAGYGVRTDERVNSRNGYRPRGWDTRAGTLELAIPKLRSGSYFPDWLLERRKRAEPRCPQRTPLDSRSIASARCRPTTPSTNP